MQPAMKSVSSTILLHFYLRECHSFTLIRPKRLETDADAHAVETLSVNGFTFLTVRSREAVRTSATEKQSQEGDKSKKS